jgi:hypothetical protein
MRCRKILQGLSSLILLLGFNAAVCVLGLYVGDLRLRQLHQANAPFIDEPFHEAWFWHILVQASLWISVTQLLYVIPLTTWLERHHKNGWLMGVLGGAILTILFNFILFWYALSQIPCLSDGC